MPPPTSSEIRELQRWSVFEHYQKYSLKYIIQARIVVDQLPNQVQALTQDEIAEGLNVWLSKNSEWQKYLARKIHMSDAEREESTVIMCRLIAYQDYDAITGGRSFRR